MAVDATSRGIEGAAKGYNAVKQALGFSGGSNMTGLSEAQTRAMLLDIEGTTSSLSFVKDELFPYARARLPTYVTEHAQELSALFNEVRGIEGDAALDPQQVIAALLDRKSVV